MMLIGFHPLAFPTACAAPWSVVKVHQGCRARCLRGYWSVEAGEQLQPLGAGGARLGRLEHETLPPVFGQFQRFLGEREGADFGVVVGADDASAVADVMASPSGRERGAGGAELTD
jgi:hypothetical protein